MNYTISLVVNFNKIPQLLNNLEVKPPEIIEKLGKQTTSFAQTFVAVDTGALRDSIHYVMESDTSVAIFPGGLANYRTGRPVELYMFPQEFGTYKMAAHPFMTPAAESIAPIAMSPGTWMPLVQI